MRKHNVITWLMIFAAGFALSAVMNGRNLPSMASANLINPAAHGVAAQTTQTPSTIQKWEYRVVTKYILRENKADIDFELNRLGEQGYEVCGVSQSSGPNVGAYLTIALRRPKQ